MPPLPASHTASTKQQSDTNLVFFAFDFFLSFFLSIFLGTWRQELALLPRAHHCHRRGLWRRLQQVRWLQRKQVRPPNLPLFKGATTSEETTTSEVNDEAVDLPGGDHAAYVQ